MTTETDAAEQERWLAKARTLSEALPYMRRYAGQTFVVKYGGHAMVDPELAALFAADVVLLRQVGINPVVVHGGGPQIARMLERLQIESTFVEGLRVTDKETVDVVEMVLTGTINKQIVTAINQAGGFAAGLSGKDGTLLQARKTRRTVTDSETGENKTVDLGYVGEPEKVNPHILDYFRESDVIPVIAPLGVGPEGESYNVNADTAAGALASALKAKRLLMLSDVAGVQDSEGNFIRDMSVADARQGIHRGAIQGGMIPKVETCVSAAEHGVEAAVVLDGRVPHSLLLEFFTPHGAGTMIREGDT